MWWYKFKSLWLLVASFILAGNNYTTCQQHDLEFRQISTQEGLPGATLRQQFQDHKGIMWIAVEATGLCRYDGHVFTLYTHDPDDPYSISSNYVNAAAEDTSGNIWVATDYGLNVYRKEENKFTSFFNKPNDPTSLPNNIVHSVFYDSKKIIS